MPLTNVVVDTLQRLRLIPVISIESADRAAPLIEAIVNGGLPCAEVTFRTAAAADALAIIASRTDVLVGAGTILTIDQVKQAVDQGAQFIVAPGFNPKVVGYCVEHEIPVVPGVSNPTDIELALEFGLDVLKFFPAEAFGGLPTLQAMSAPYGSIRFIPTGGITPYNLPAYLQSPKVLACGGSWMVKSNLISAGKFCEITGLVAEAVALIQDAGVPGRLPNGDSGA